MRRAPAQTTADEAPVAPLVSAPAKIPAPPMEKPILND
jgi:hypothetical protein